jgi:uncharacterized protein (UPF0333 family)
MVKKLNNQAQALSEVSLISAIIVAAVVGMAVYAQRSIQSGIHAVKNSMLASAGVESTEGYEPYYRESVTNQESTATSQSIFGHEGGIRHESELEISSSGYSIEASALEADEDI